MGETSAPGLLPSRRLWPHQVDALAAVVSGLGGGGRGQLVMACGTGKTLVALRAAEQLVPPAGLVVVLAPTLALVRQTLDVWRCDARRGFAGLAVCSDSEIAADPVAHWVDLAGGVQVSTDPAAIGEWVTMVPHRRVVVGTYRSAGRLGQALRETGVCADLLVCDEAHHLAGLADLPTARVVNDQVLPARRRLFATATPRIGADARQRDPDVLSMDDEAVFGPVLYTYPVSQAIAEGYLKDYRLAVIGIPDSQARRIITERGGPRRGGDLRIAAAQAALAKAVDQHDLRRVITFHSRVADAARFTRTLPATVATLPDHDRPAGPLRAAHLHGRTPASERRRILDTLADLPGEGWACVSNVRVLGEGVDMPGVDGILFVDPKGSAVDIVQAVGRALRRHPGGAATATLIVPIIVPGSRQVRDRAIDPHDYQILWQIVRALRAHDQALAADLNLAATSPQQPHRDSAERLPDRIALHLPEGIAGRLADEVALVFVETATSSLWWQGYRHARDFHAEHGHLRIGSKHRTAEGYPLGQWISSRRKDHRNGRLSAERVALLDALGMIWQARPPRTRGPAAQRWQAKYDEVVAYHAEHGHLRFGYGQHRDLTAWLRAQRRFRHQLTPQQIDALNAIGMIWDASDLAWQTGYAEAAAFHAEHGHLRVPYRYITPTGHKLWTWVNQRRMDRSRNRLSAERIAALDRIGMAWNPVQQRWERGHTAAKAFHAEHGHLDVHYSHVTTEGFKLGWWIRHQRDLRAGDAPGGITPDRIAALDALGMTWTTPKTECTQRRRREPSDCPPLE